MNAGMCQFVRSTTKKSHGQALGVREWGFSNDNFFWGLTLSLSYRWLLIPASSCDLSSVFSLWSVLLIRTRVLLEYSPLPWSHLSSISFLNMPSPNTLSKYSQKQCRTSAYEIVPNSVCNRNNESTYLCRSVMTIMRLKQLNHFQTCSNSLLLLQLQSVWSVISGLVSVLNCSHVISLKPHLSSKSCF